MARNPKQRFGGDDEAVQATAAAWMAQRDEGMSAEEEAAFARWRQSDPRHDAAIVRLERTWSALQVLRDFRPEAHRHPDPDLLADESNRRAWRWPAVLVTAGMAAALLFAALWWWPRAIDPARARSAYATTVGGYERIALADGSVMELNANTEVEVKFTAADRRVELRRGEAHFQVAKNKARPFLVRAGGVTVRAVGTAFDVRLDPRAVQVLVIEGSVQVHRPAQAVTVEAAPPLVVAGERAVIATAEPGPSTPLLVEKIAPADIRESLAWQGPRLVFVDTPLSEVVTQFNRQNQLQIVIGDEELGLLPVGGSFRAENVDAFVRLLTSGNGIVAERPGPNLIVLKKSPR
jgi:transmembrane sensor